MDRKKEIQVRLEEIKNESIALKKELEEIGKSYDEKYFQSLKDENPGLWYRWNWQENSFFHFTGFVSSQQDLIRPVKRFTFKIDTRVSVLNYDEEYLKITIDRKKDTFTFDENEFVPISVEEVRKIVKDAQEKQTEKLF